MRIQTSKGEITSIDAWFACAPPKGKLRQWVDGRSAKELAKAWFVSGAAAPPHSMRALIESHPDFSPIIWDYAEPEARIRFDRIKGEPRNTDLVIRARDEHGPIAVSVEAKADEVFGPLLGDALADALDRRTINPRSRGVARIEQLVDALLPPKNVALPELKSIRYQLLTATAGALAWAKQVDANRAVVVVHEFRSIKSNRARQELNHADLDRFIRRVAGSNMQPNIRIGQLLGPIDVPGAPLFDKPAQLYFGIIATEC
jgi:hypothetical protein